jgi:hypothetical protein
MITQLPSVGIVPPAQVLGLAAGPFCADAIKLVVVHGKVAAYAGKETMRRRDRTPTTLGEGRDRRFKGYLALQQGFSF